MGRVCDKHGDGPMRLGWKPHTPATNRDACEKCGMSGLAIMQNPHIGCV